MDTRTYRARTLQDALDMVRRELGPDASILETRSRSAGILGWFRGSGAIEVVASNTIHVPSRLGNPGRRPGSDQSDDAPGAVDPVPHKPRHAVIDEGPSLVADLCQSHGHSSGLGNSELACQLMHRIGQQGIPEPQLQRLFQQLDKIPQATNSLQQAHEQLADHLAGQIQVTGQFQPGRDQQHTLAAVGPSGTGKTINLLKLATQFQLQQHYKVGLITADTSRLTSVDQLRTYTEMFQIPLEVAATAREMRRARQQFTGFDLILVDTAGIRPGDLSAIRSQRSVLVEAGIDEIMLVLNANSSHDSMLEAVEGFGTVGITSLMLTKFDEATRLGQLLPLLEQSHLPVGYISDGQGIPQDLRPAESRWLARRLLGCHLTAGAATGQPYHDHV